MCELSIYVLLYGIHLCVRENKLVMVIAPWSLKKKERKKKSNTFLDIIYLNQ